MTTRWKRTTATPNRARQLWIRSFNKRRRSTSSNSSSVRASSSSPGSALHSNLPNLRASLTLRTTDGPSPLQNSSPLRKNFSSISHQLLASQQSTKGLLLRTLLIIANTISFIRLEIPRHGVPLLRLPSSLNRPALHYRPHGRPTRLTHQDHHILLSHQNHHLTPASRISNCLTTLYHHHLRTVIVNIQRTVGRAQPRWTKRSHRSAATRRVEDSNTTTTTTKTPPCHTTSTRPSSTVASEPTPLLRPRTATRPTFLHTQRKNGVAWEVRRVALGRCRWERRRRRVGSFARVEEGERQGWTRWEKGERRTENFLHSCHFSRYLDHRDKGSGGAASVTYWLRRKCCCVGALQKTFKHQVNSFASNPFATMRKTSLIATALPSAKVWTALAMFPAGVRLTADTYTPVAFFLVGCSNMLYHCL